MDGIEVYLRPSGDRLLLNFHVPSHLRERFITSLQEGFLPNDVPIAFEMDVQPGWFANPADTHVRLPLNAITVADSA